MNKDGAKGGPFGALGSTNVHGFPTRIPHCVDALGTEGVETTADGEPDPETTPRREDERRAPRRNR